MLGILDYVIAANNTVYAKENITYINWEEEGNRPSAKSITGNSDDFKINLYDVWNLMES